jgi:mRNA interferase MazF
VVIQQGDVYWVDLGSPSGSGPGLLRPYVVVQNNVFNQSRINTVVICGLTSNLRRAEALGNVLLKDGEAQLPKPSVVNISQLYTVDKDDLVDKIGSLSRESLQEVVRGLQMLVEPMDDPDWR